MLVRVGLAVTVSVAAYTLQQLQRKKQSKNTSAEAGHADENKHQNEEYKKELYAYTDVESTQEEQEEEEEVKRVNSVMSPSFSKSFSDGEKMLFPEFEDLFSSSLEYQSEKGSLPRQISENDRLSKLSYEAAMEGNSAELNRLRDLVKQLEEREVKLEGELLEYYGMQEQQTSIGELQRLLQIKVVEIDMLKLRNNSLEAQKKKMEEEVVMAATGRKELEAARTRIKELQKQIQMDSGQTKEQLLMLKQQVITLQAKEKEAFKKDFEIEKKLHHLKELDVEVVELRRANKELQHEKRELTVELDAMEAKITMLSNMTESEMVAKAREDADSLWHMNADLSKQVEGLQLNRFSEVEELVYLRWVNACLRYELRNYQAPPGKITARDLSKELSPKSQEKAKQLMLEYAGPDLPASCEKTSTEADFESVSPQPSTPSESDDFDDASIDSSSSRRSSFRKLGLIQKLKKWGRSKDELTMSPGSSFSDGRGDASSPLRSPGYRRHSVSKGSLEALMLKNTSDKFAITSVGRRDQESGLGRVKSNSSIDYHDTMTSMVDSPERTSLPPIRTRTNGNDNSLNNVASSFQLMSKSVGGMLDEKYPAFKDRHRLAVQREKTIKEKAELARAEKFVGKADVSGGQVRLEKPVGTLSPKTTTEKPIGTLAPKITIENPIGTLAPKSTTEKPMGTLATRFAAKNECSNDQSSEHPIQSPEISKLKLAEMQKRSPWVPKPPPKPSASSSNSTPVKALTGIPAPPPRPPPPRGAPGAPPLPPPPPGGMPKSQGPTGQKVHRAPELVEFYQSLMRREAKKENTTMASAAPNVAEARNNMIGEIENRSAFLLSVRADVETQGDFVQSLATEVRAAAYTNIEDVVAFVNWLDEELSFLVDERAVLKHFDWPENKADVLREAAFEYQDLKKLESEVNSFVDDPKFSCDAALKKMYCLLEKVEQSVYALLRTRDMAIARYKEFRIPTNWLLDSGVVGKIKLASVQLARKYMKRVASELDNTINVPEKEPMREFILLQGVRFAFRVHQFAGGFDAESMRAFEELRGRAHAQDEATDRSSSTN